MKPASDPGRPTLWISDDPLVLASASPVRSRIMDQAGLRHEVLPVDLDERELESQIAGAPPAAVALTLSRAKALAGSLRRPGAIVIGADQTLECDGAVFHKSTTVAEARVQLQALRGKPHRLNSGIAVCRNGNVETSGVVNATLLMREFSNEFIDRYLESATTTILGSVGCYQIEGLGAHLFAKIEGDQFTIMGLPLLQLLDWFRTSGYVSR